MKKFYLSLLSLCLLGILSAQPEKSISQGSKIQETSVSNKKARYPAPSSFAKEIVYSIDYAPSYGFFLGTWPISVNFSIAKGFLEWSTTFAKKFEWGKSVPGISSEYSPNAVVFHTVVGPRLMIPSKGLMHFYIHALMGIGTYSESWSGKYWPFEKINESHTGLD